MRNLSLGLGLSPARSVLDKVADLLALIDTAVGSSFHDFTTATDTGTYVADDQSANNLDFVRATSNKPGIDAALGATFPGP